MIIKNLYKRVTSTKWEIGFPTNSLENIVNGDSLNVRWVHNPYKDHWFADPFILDVTDDDIIVLVEDMPINKSIFKKNKVRGKASISKLTVNRHTYKIEKRDLILDLPTHLSFPNILRKENKVYVYPENAYGGNLSLYEFDEKTNKLIYKETILDDIVWDSEINDMFGVEMIFTCKQNDYHLDIYRKDTKTNKFIYWQSVKSDHRNMRMAGKFFKIGDKIYCPSQNSDRNYGNATELKEVQYQKGKFSF